MSLCLLFLFKTAVAGELQLRPVAPGRGTVARTPSKPPFPLGSFLALPKCKSTCPRGVGGGGVAAVPQSSQLPAPQASEATGQMHADESGGRVGEQTAASRVPCPGCLLEHFCLPAHGPGQSNCCCGAWGSSCKAHVVPCLAEPHHVAGLDGRPRQGLAPSAACQGARCCHWKKLLHNLKSWSFDHGWERMERRGSKW